ncbi:hypothetical protein T492DRAFT_1034764 [Pavlovales sp. CCMP2436]|nr:hypothetical protein T492DRAFT_1034764 [Pavlovales sp. CCMP2436]
MAMVVRGRASTRLLLFVYCITNAPKLRQGLYRTGYYLNSHSSLFSACSSLFCFVFNTYLAPNSRVKGWCVSLGVFFASALRGF